MRDGLLIAMVLKGLPPNFKPFYNGHNPEEKLDFFLNLKYV